MPTLTDIVTVPYEHDGRRKITDEQKQEVRRLHEIEGLAIREITRRVGISRRSVQFILFPERAEAVKARRKEVKRWEKYNKAEYHTPYMRNHRAKKKLLLKKGLVKITEENLTKYEKALEKNRERTRVWRQKVKDVSQ